LAEKFPGGGGATETSKKAQKLAKNTEKMHYLPLPEKGGNGKKTKK